MSTLNSQDVMRMVLNGEKPSNDMVVAAGLDVEQLQWLIDELAPHMDYLRGYASLDSMFRSTAHIPFAEWLKEANLSGEYRYCLQLFSKTFVDRQAHSTWFPIPDSERSRYLRSDGTPYEIGNRYARIRVFLTRKGEWIVWANYPQSVFKLASNVKQALEFVEQLTPEGMGIDYGQFDRSCSPALSMFYQLVKIFRESIETKARDLASEKKTAAQISVKLERISS